MRRIITNPISILILLAAGLITVFAAHVFPFTTDSLIYTSTARNIYQDKGIVFDNVYVRPVEPDFLPLNLHPPGYPFLITFLRLLGVDIHTAALTIPRFFFLLLPIAFFLVFSQIMPNKLSLVTAGLSTFMFPYLKCALMAWSDIPFLFFCLISLYLFFRAVKTGGREQLWCCFLAGIATGFALLLRNVGYALALSIGLSFVLMTVLKMVSMKRFFRMGLLYVLGFAVMDIPYLIRNYIVFGRLNPFTLPPAQVTLKQNWADYSHTLANMILTDPFFDTALMIILAGMAIWFITRAKKTMVTDKKILVCAGALALYFAAGSGLLLLSKTLYFMPERINERYLIQYAWIIMAGLSYSIYSMFLAIKRTRPVDIKGVSVLLITVFVLVQTFPAADFYFQQKNILKIASKVHRSVPLLKQLPEDHIIVSNVTDMAGFFTGRSVRMLNGYMPRGLTHFLGSKRKFAVFIYKERDKNYRAYLYPLSWLDPEGYRAVHEDEDVLLLLPEENI